MTPDEANRERAIDAQRVFAEEIARQQRETLAEDHSCCPVYASYGYHGFGCTAPRNYCCIGYARGIGHDGTCTSRFSRSAGS